MAVYALPQTSGDISFWFATTNALFCDNLFRNPSQVSQKQIKNEHYVTSPPTSGEIILTDNVFF